MITFTTTIDRNVRVGAESHWILNYMKDAIGAWSDGDREHVYFYEPSSLCFRRTNPPFAFWRLDHGAFDRYGPLPFTAGGKPIRWTWRYRLKSAPILTVTAADLL